MTDTNARATATSNSRWRDEDMRERHSDSRQGRGFFERAGDEIASWFGDDDAEHARREHERRCEERGRPRLRPRL